MKKKKGHMFCYFKKKQAQFVSEYSIVLAIAVFAIVGMTFFMQRGFNARIRDARVYMSRTLDPYVDQAYQQRAQTQYSGIIYEYEPYYVNKTSDTANDSFENLFLNGAQNLYQKQMSQTTSVTGASWEAAPRNDFPTFPTPPDPTETSEEDETASTQ